MLDLLMIEDDVELLNLTCSLFEASGINSTKASSFDQAFNIISRGRRFDVYMIDIRLGDKSGLDLINPIVENRHAPLPKIIIASGNVNSKIRNNRYVWKVFEKPYDIHLLIAEVLSSENEEKCST